MPVLKLALGRVDGVFHLVAQGIGQLLRAGPKKPRLKALDRLGSQGHKPFKLGAGGGGLPLGTGLGVAKLLQFLDGLIVLVKMKLAFHQNFPQRISRGAGTRPTTGCLRTVARARRKPGSGGRRRTSPFAGPWFRTLGELLASQFGAGPVLRRGQCRGRIQP